MPKEADLQLQNKDGQPLAAPVHVVFEDDEWAVLTRFAEYAGEVAETPVLRNSQGVSTSLTVDLTTGTQSHSVVVPPKAEIQALLHVMRPFVLQSEPTAFNKVVNILKRHIPEDRIRASFERQKAIFSGEEFQQKMKMTASAGPGTEAVLNSEATFQLWLNAYEYHRDEDKKAAMKELHVLLPFEWLRAMFISMMMDRSLAVLNIANFIHFLETSAPGSGRKFKM